MLQDKTIKQKDYERASQLLGELFEVDSDITEQISRCIQYYGQNFFKTLNPSTFQQMSLKAGCCQACAVWYGRRVMPEVLTMK